MQLVWLPIDTWIAAIAIVTAMACALPGCYLMLRRQAMLGDAIAHAVLPGIALGYLLFGGTDPAIMLLGAAAMGILTALLVQLVHQVGRVDEGAAMGVVFTTLFALGLVMVRRAADNVHLDAEHVIFGAIELAPARTMSIGPWQLPRALFVSLVMLFLNMLFIALLYKELRVAVFDPAFARAAGLRPGITHYSLIAFTASTMVVAFEAVGSILVLAMLIVPGATARLLTNRLLPLLLVALFFAALSAVLGHLAAITLPQLAGFEDASTSGMIAVVSGALFGFVVFLAPREGILPRLVHQFRVGVRTLSEDVLGALFRARELTHDDHAGVDRAHLEELLGGGLPLTLALLRLSRRQKIRFAGGVYTLTDLGEASARKLVRRHRLWETWLVEELGLRADHVHGTAERLEHLAGDTVTATLEAETAGKSIDPQNKVIPEPPGQSDTQS